MKIPFCGKLIPIKLQNNYIHRLFPAQQTLETPSNKKHIAYRISFPAENFRGCPRNSTTLCHCVVL